MVNIVYGAFKRIVGKIDQYIPAEDDIEFSKASPRVRIDEIQAHKLC
jgi:hypothetical protein